VGFGVDVMGYDGCFESRCSFSGDRKISLLSSSGRWNRTLVSRPVFLVGVDSALWSLRRNRGGDSGGLSISSSGDGGSGIVGIEYSLGNA
jgi:hypothetical protein